MNTSLSDAIEFFIGAFIELAVLFIVISFLVELIQWWLPTEKVQRILSGNKGYAVAVALGVVTPFCSCSTLPMTTGLIRANAPFGPIMAFLLTSPLLNPYIVGLFAISFGITVTLVYGLSVIIFALGSGMVLSRFNFARFVRAELVSGCASSGCSKETEKSAFSILYFAQRAVKQWLQFLPYIIIGVLVGAVIHGFIPHQWIAELQFIHPLILIPVLAVLSLLLYVRASTMVPIALSLVGKGLSMGAVMSLTIAGAGASLPELIMMKKMFHWPLLAAFLVVVFSTACVTGWTLLLLGF